MSNIDRPPSLVNDIRSIRARIREMELMPPGSGPGGPSGPAGADGELWFTGSGAPAGGLAGSEVGDWYLDSANGDFYEKTGVSTWTFRGNLKGATGNTGATGGVGPQGPAGGFYEGALQEGVLTTASCALTVNTTAQVTVADGVKPAYIKDSSGLLLRIIPAATVLGSIPAASASNFRLDCIAISSANVISRIQGTEGTGVTLDNRTGAGSIPAGSRALHDILVTSAGVLSANVRDRRPNAAGGFFYVSRINGSDYTRTTATFDWIDGTNLRFRMECTGVPMKLTLMGSMYAGSSSTEVAGYLGFMELLSGVSSHIDGQNRGYWVNNQIYRAFHYETTITPAAGSHLYGPVFKGDGTNALVIGSQTNFPLIMRLEEVPRSNFNNGIT